MSRTTYLHAALEAPRIPFSFWYISFVILVIVTESLLRKKKQSPKYNDIIGRNRTNNRATHATTHFSTFPWRIRHKRKIKGEVPPRRKRTTVNLPISTFSSKPFRRRNLVLQYCVHVKQDIQDGIIVKHFRTCVHVHFGETFTVFAAMFAYTPLRQRQDNKTWQQRHEMTDCDVMWRKETLESDLDQFAKEFNYWIVTAQPKNLERPENASSEWKGNISSETISTLSSLSS